MMHTGGELPYAEGDGWQATSLAYAFGDLEMVFAVGDTATIGKVLFTNYLLPFEIVSLLLLVAMVGAVLVPL